MIVPLQQVEHLILKVAGTLNLRHFFFLLFLVIYSKEALIVICGCEVV